MKRLLFLLVVLAFGSAYAESDYWKQKKAEPFSGLYVTTSVLHVGSDDARISWQQYRDPSIDIHTGSTWGLALGLGWRFPSGWEWSASVLSLRSDLEVNWSQPPYGAGPITQPGDTSRTGFMVSFNVPLLRSCK